MDQAESGTDNHREVFGQITMRMFGKRQKQDVGSVKSDISIDRNDKCVILGIGENMNIKSYFDVELRTVTVYAIAAVLMGYISFYINHTTYATLAMLVVLIILTFAMKAVLKIKEGVKWWLGNGVIVYLFLWLIVWTIFYNAYVL